MVKLDKKYNSTVRNKEINYLKKLLPQIKNGYSKSILLTGDLGAGKTHLLNDFSNLARISNCKVINIEKFDFNSPEDFFVSFVESFEKECHSIIKDTMTKINSFYDDQKIWKEKDLKKALNILKLQNNPDDDITPLKISKSLKGSMNIFSKLIPNFDGSLDVMSELLNDPWVIMAYNLDNPAYSTFSNALSLVQIAKNRNNKQYSTTNTYKDAIFNFLFHVNKNLKEKDTALIITVDNFENIAECNHRQKDSIIKLFNDLLETIQNNNGLNLMLLVACASEKQSQALSNNLYSQFTNRMLLSSLSLEDSINLTKNLIEQKHISCCSSIVEIIAEFSNGMPYWLDKNLCFCAKVASTINIEDLNKDLLLKFLPEKNEDILKSLYSIFFNRFNQNKEDINLIIDYISSLDNYFSIFNVVQSLKCSEKIVQEVILALTEFEFLEFIPGQGYNFRHKIDRNFFKEISNNQESFNIQLISLLSLLGEVKRQILNTENPSKAVLSLLDYSSNSMYNSINKQLIKLLKSALGHNNSKARISAINGFETIGDYESLIAISGMLKDSDDEVKITSLDALKTLLNIIDKNKNDFSPVLLGLQSLLQDKNHLIRIKAIETLCIFNLDLIHPIIKTFLNDPNEYVRASIISCLSQNLKSSDFFIYKDKSRDKSAIVRSLVAKNLYKFRDDRSFQLLVLLLNDKDKTVRKEAAKSIGRMRHNDANKVLIKSINDPEEDVKLEVIKSLGLIGDNKSIPFIHKEITETESVAIQWAGTKALGCIPSKDAVAALDRSLISNNAFVKEAANNSVQKIHAAMENI